MNKQRYTASGARLRIPFSAISSLALLSLCASTAVANTTLWRIGKADNSNTEFTGPASSSLPASYTIPSNWSSLTTWSTWPSSVGTTPGVTTINYTLASVPTNGVLFTFKPVTATVLVPELAVYSNDNPCGIIQIGGAADPVGIVQPSGSPTTYKRTFSRIYQIYIPAQFLVSGANKLQMNRLGHPFQRTSATNLDFSIDYLQLDKMAAPATEPLHGKLTYVGFSDGQMAINPSSVAKEQAEAEWMGVAYSGNPERVTFWNSVTSEQDPASQLAYLQTLKSLNMTVILDGWGCFHTTNASIVNGQLPDDGSKPYIHNLLANYGSLVRFYEVTNEPTQWFTASSLNYCAAAARYVNSIKPVTLIVAAPGYSFGNGLGDPVNWDGTSSSKPGQPSEDQCIANRKTLDDLCGAYNGHNWGYLTWGDNSSLAENIDSHGTFVNGGYQVTNGWDKPMITTECGTSTDMYDIPSTPAQTKTSLLDRNLRLNVATQDYMCVADIWNNGAMFDYLNGNPMDPTTWAAAPSDPSNSTGDSDTPVKTLRRLALAYGTHGAPLPYTWVNTNLASLPLIYFRAVDTSTLAPIPGSGATSNKILLSFVNFDMLKPQTVSVHVKMPVAGTYTGVCYNSANGYTAARNLTRLPASPYVTMSVTLGPGESTEYILTRPAHGTKQASK